MSELLEQPPENVRLALFHVQALRQMRSLNPKANIDAVLQPMLSDGFTSTYEPATNSLLAWYLGGNRARKILYVDGCVNNSQAVGLVAGYNDATLVGDFLPVNSWLEENLRVMNAKMLQGHVVEPENLDLVGYSAGGALATLKMWEYVRRQSVIKRKLITFGSPRAITRNRRDLLNRSPVARWFTDADPIPLVPPRVADVPQLVALLSPVGVIRYGNYVHTDGGISVAQNGITTPAVLPPASAISQFNSLSSWFWSEENNPNNTHALTSYFAYLSAAVAMLPTPAQQNVELGANEPPQQENQREITRRQKQIANAINEAGHAQNAGPQTVPEELLMVPFRVGRVWYVSFNGDVICTAPIEKRARAIARHGNAFLRALPKQALVDPVALSQQLTNWLGFAQDPTWGFSPQINTTLEV
jgi:hypothetical protein